MTGPRGKKLDIDKAALALFARKGVLQTTIKDIAGEAGVTDGALYRHYESKEDMAWKLFLKELARFNVGLKASLGAAGKPIDARIAAAVRYTLEYHENNPERLAFLLLTRHSFAAERLIAPEGNPVELIRQALDEAVAKGEIAPCRTRFLTALIMGVVLHPIELLRYREKNEARLDAEQKQRILEASLVLLPLTPQYHSENKGPA
jgi:AcrR family transcriptional regulator